MMNKMMIKQKADVPFNHAKSIFKQWQKDTPDRLKIALKYDFAYWKGSKVLKNKSDLWDCEELIRKHFGDLKLIFTNLQSGDSYPFVGWIDFGAFCRSVEITDSQINGPTIDNIFFATKFNPQPGGENKQLYRHEFLEILVRIALAKYLQTGVAETPRDALQMLIDLIIKKF
jgi:hypothetical protein